MAAGLTELQADETFSTLRKSISQSIAQVAFASQQDAKIIQNDIRVKLTELRASIRLFEEYAEEQDSEEESARLFVKVSEQRRSYEALQTDLRKAVLQRQKHNEELAINERKALMGSPEARQRQQERRNEADIAGTSESITASLQRTRQQMAQELEHTAATLAAMDVSDEVLKDAKTEFQGHKAGHKRSHQLLGTMRRHSVLDFLTLWGGLSIFMMVVVYIVAKRSYYFVPNFARNVVMMPFRSRNSTTIVEDSHSLASMPNKADVGSIPNFEQHFGQENMPVIGLEATGEVDLSSSADAEAGLSERDLDLAKASAELEQAFKEATARSSEQAVAAHPGVAEQPMQASTASSLGSQKDNSTVDGIKTPDASSLAASISGSITSNRSQEAGQEASDSTLASPSPVNDSPAEDPDQLSLPPEAVSSSAQEQTGIPEEARRHENTTTDAGITSPDNLSSPEEAARMETGSTSEERKHGASESGGNESFTGGISTEEDSGSGSNTVDPILQTSSEIDPEPQSSDNGSLPGAESEGNTPGKEGDQLNASVTKASNSPMNESGNDHSWEDAVQNSSDGQQPSAELIDNATSSQANPPSTIKKLSDEAVKAPPSSGGVWDDADAEVQEPLSESSTELDRDSWQNKERPSRVDSTEQPSRQEDTELGIFRPDEL